MNGMDGWMRATERQISGKPMIGLKFYVRLQSTSGRNLKKKRLYFRAKKNHHPERETRKWKHNRISC